MQIDRLLPDATGLHLNGVEIMEAAVTITLTYHLPQCAVPALWHGGDAGA
jgi:hypothetical protein